MSESLRLGNHSFMQAYVNKHGQQYGPFTVDQLEDQVLKGTLTGDDLACLDGVNWIPIREIPNIGVTGKTPPEEAVDEGKASEEEIHHDTPKPKASKQLVFAGAALLVTLLFLLTLLLKWMAGEDGFQVDGESGEMDDFFTQTEEEMEGMIKGATIVLSAKGVVSIMEPAPDGNESTKEAVVPRSPKEREVLPPGVEIKTGDDSEAVLLFTNGSLATIGPNSTLRIANYAQQDFNGSKVKLSDLQNEASPSHLKLDLDLGELVVEVKKLNKKSSFLVPTLVGSAGIRGTQFRVVAEKTTTVSVLEGSVLTQSVEKKTYSLTEGRSVRLGRATAKLLPCSEADLERIKTSNANARQLCQDLDLNDLARFLREINQGLATVEEEKKEIDSLSKGLVAWYPFDGNASDMSGNKHHGSVVGASSWIKDGKVNGALSFNGNGNRVMVKSSPKLQLGQGKDKRWTVSLWYKRMGTSTGWRSLISKAHGRGSANTDYVIAVEKNGFFWGTGSSKDKSAWLWAREPSRGNWHHLIATLVATGKSSGKKNLYVDGKRIRSVSYKIKTSGKKSDLKIGYRAFKGLIDDVRFYNRALSDAEVKTLFDLRN